MKENCVPITVSLEPSLIYKLKIIAKREAMSFSAVLRRQLRQYVANYELKRGKLE